MLEQIVRRREGEALVRLWIITDLQQRIPERAEYCMTRAVEDFLSLELPVDAVCYLGDSVEGNDLGFIRTMTDMQIDRLSRVSAPKYYVVGNHDYEYFRYHQKHSGLAKLTLPFYEAVRALPDWHVQDAFDTFCFTEDFGPFAAWFFPDHGDPAGAWHTTNGEVWGDARRYIYDDAAYAAVREAIAACPKPVFTFSHYAFPGGNRESPLLGRFLPLPQNVRMHFYGHAHIGDSYWAGKDCYRKLSAVDGQPIVQVNCSSLENFRGSAIRSVFLEYYADGDIAVLFRNHTLRRWDEWFLQAQ